MIDKPEFKNGWNAGLETAASFMENVLKAEIANAMRSLKYVEIKQVSHEAKVNCDVVLVDEVARALLNVRAEFPASDGIEHFILSSDPDFDDLPKDPTEGTENDDITKEAVRRLARAAIEVVRSSPFAAVTEGEPT